MLQIELADANTYFTNRLNIEVWSGASNDERIKALLLAAEIIDAAYQWKPEASSLDENGNTVWHSRIIAAVCEQALLLLKHDPDFELNFVARGISSATVPGCSLTFSKDAASLIGPLVKLLIGKYGIPVIDNESHGSVDSSCLNI